MAGITIDEMKRRENEAYRAGLRRAGKGRTTKILLWILTGAYLLVLVYSLADWTFKSRYPSEIMNGITAGYFAFVGTVTVKSGAENYGKITHAEEYNTYHGDA